VKVINLFGAPGAGKSTAAAGLFYEMKKRWFNVELVTEFAKELVWSGNAHMLSEQNYVFSHQEHRLNRLRSKIDVAVSDAPLLLSAFYAPPHYHASFRQSVFDFFHSYDNLNILVRRSHRYSAVGRIQNQEESDALAAHMEQYLHANGIPYHIIEANDSGPRYLLAWLVSQGHLSMPEEAAPFGPADQAPPGWLTSITPDPVTELRLDAGLSATIRTVGERS
jgi:hypothetical protein